MHVEVRVLSLMVGVLSSSVAISAPRLREKQCFALEINRRPVLAFFAKSLRSARIQAGQSWFLEELERMRSNGKSLLSSGDERAVRPARPEEIKELEVQRGLDEEMGEDLKYCFAFLVPIDAELN
jgi:hypothetical protein